MQTTKRTTAALFPTPGNERATATGRIRSAIIMSGLLLLAILFATTAAAWVSSLSNGARPAAAATGTPFSREALARMADSPVAVLVPSSLQPEQAEEFVRRFRATPDGFFTRLSLPAYDVVLNGSRGGAGESEVRISETETGLAAMFSREGAVYQIEFNCRGPGAESGARCLGEDEARSFVADLVVAARPRDGFSRDGFK